MTVSAIYLGRSRVERALNFKVPHIKMELGNVIIAGLTLVVCTFLVTVGKASFTEIHGLLLLVLGHYLGYRSRSGNKENEED